MCVRDKGGVLEVNRMTKQHHQTLKKNKITLQIKRSAQLCFGQQPTFLLLHYFES